MAEVGLRGLVKTCCVHRRLSSDEDPIVTIIFEFASNGLCERRTTIDRRGAEWRAVFEHDDTGRLVLIQDEGPNGWTQRRVREFDERGRLRRVVLQGGVSGTKVLESYTYDEAGAMTQTRHLEPAGDCAHRFWDVDGTDGRFASRGAIEIVTLCDEAGRATQALFRDRGGCIVNRVELRYDDRGRLVEERSLRGALPPAVSEIVGAGDDTMRRLFRYDDHDRRVAMVLPSEDGRRTVETHYNDQGDEDLVTSVEEDWSDENGDGRVLGPTGLRVRTLRTSFHYRYDRRGNWVTQLSQVRGADGNEYSTESVERAIVYY